MRFVDSLEQGLLYSQIYPVGDFNGDGYDDLAFLSVDDRINQSFWDLRLVYGTGSGLQAIVDVRDLPASQVTRLGVHFQDAVVGGGDTNGDALGDLIINTSGSEESYLVYGRDGDARQPASPSKVRAALSANLIELRWDVLVAPHLVAYEISRGGDILAIQDNELIHYEDKTAQRDTGYTYRVRALDQEGLYSEAATIVVQNDKSLCPSIVGQVYSTHCCHRPN